MKPELKALLLGLAAVLIGAAVTLHSSKGDETAPAASEEPVTVESVQPVEDYVRANISTLSPEPEVLGGTFYVTDVEARGGAGTVSYEDGHNAFTADFTYSVDASGIVSVTSFTVRD